MNKFDGPPPNYINTYPTDLSAGGGPAILRHKAMLEPDNTPFKWVHYIIYSKISPRVSFKLNLPLCIQIRSCSTFLLTYFSSGQRTTSLSQPDVSGIFWSNRKFFRRPWSVTSSQRKESRARSAAGVPWNVVLVVFLQSPVAMMIKPAVLNQSWAPVYPTVFASVFFVSFPSTQVLHWLKSKSMCGTTRGSHFV